MTAQTTPTLFGRIGRALRRMAQIYVEARMMQARWHVLSRLDPEQFRSVSGERFTSPIQDFVGAATPPASANDDQRTRRAA